jgi:hypothetical protein
MRNFEFEELIEKAFSMGYECALEEQKEFARSDYEGLTKRQKEALRQKRRDYAINLNKIRNGFNKKIEDYDWDDSLGSLTSSAEIVGGGIRTKVKSTTSRDGRNGSEFKKAHRGNYFGELLKQSEAASDLMRQNVEKEIKPGTSHKGKGHENAPNSFLNIAGKSKGDFRKNERDRELRKNGGFFDKWKYEDGDYYLNEFRNNEELNEKLKDYKKRKQAEREYAGLFDRIEAEERLENIKNIRKKRNIKRAAALLGTGAAIGATAYGIKKYRDYKKAKQEEERRRKLEEDGE